MLTDEPSPDEHSTSGLGSDKLKVENKIKNKKKQNLNCIGFVPIFHCEKSNVIDECYLEGLRLNI